MWICWILYCLYINYTCVSVSHILHITRNYVIITCGTILKTPVSTSFTFKLHLASPSDKELISYPCFQIQKTLYWRDNFSKKKEKASQSFSFHPSTVFSLLYETAAAVGGTLLKDKRFWGFSINASYIWWMPEALKQKRIVTFFLCFFFNIQKLMFLQSKPEM